MKYWQESEIATLAVGEIYRRRSYIRRSCLGTVPSCDTEPESAQPIRVDRASPNVSRPDTACERPMAVEIVEWLLDTIGECCADFAVGLAIVGKSGRTISIAFHGGCW